MAFKQVTAGLDFYEDTVQYQVAMFIQMLNGPSKSILSGTHTAQHVSEEDETLQAAYNG